MNENNLARLLSQARYDLNKTLKQMCNEIRVSQAPLQKWESGDNLPKENRLPYISVAYRIDMEKLIEVFHISKSAREKEKLARKSERAKTSGGKLFSGEIKMNIGKAISRDVLRRNG